MKKGKKKKNRLKYYETNTRVCCMVILIFTASYINEKLDIVIHCEQQSFAVIKLKFPLIFAKKMEKKH